MIFKNWYQVSNKLYVIKRSRVYCKGLRQLYYICLYLFIP